MKSSSEATLLTHFNYNLVEEVPPFSLPF